jgi:hypothetical protein
VIHSCCSGCSAAACRALDRCDLTVFRDVFHLPCAGPTTSPLRRIEHAPQSPCRSRLRARKPHPAQHNGEIVLLRSQITGRPTPLMINLLVSP